MEVLDPFHSLITTLIIGNYFFTAWVYRQHLLQVKNHFLHLEARVVELERLVSERVAAKLEKIVPYTGF